MTIPPPPKWKKSAPEKGGTKKPTPVKPGPQKTTSKSVPTLAKWKSSIEIEEVPNDSDLIQSELPCNPWHILESADGSDDDDNANAGPHNLHRRAMDIDADSDAEEIEIVEPLEQPEEDDEEESGQYLTFSISNNYFLITYQLACQRNGLHQFMSSSRQLPKLNIRMAIMLMSSNVGPAGAKGITGCWQRSVG